jgi:hypothetical protein
VTPHQIHLQLGEALRRNGDFGELAETGVDSIDDFIALNDVVDDLARAEHALARRRRELHPSTLDGDRICVIDG